MNLNFTSDLVVTYINKNTNVITPYGFSYIPNINVYKGYLGLNLKESNFMFEAINIVQDINKIYFLMSDSRIPSIPYKWARIYLDNAGNVKNGASISFYNTREQARSNKPSTEFKIVICKVKQYSDGSVSFEKSH